MRWNRYLLSFWASWAIKLPLDKSLTLTITISFYIAMFGGLVEPVSTP